MLISDVNTLTFKSYSYDSDLGMYYLGSRWYDPEVCRFINADSYVSTGQGITGYNMFAYCNNNPVNMIDSSGDVPDKILLKNAEIYAAGGNVAMCGWKNNIAEGTISSDNKFKNKDGTYSLYDNHRNNPDSVFHEQILSGKVSTPSLSLKDGNITLGSASATLITGGWEFDHVDISLFDIGQAKIAAGYQDNMFELGAMASAWVPSVALKFGDFSINLSAHVGSIGAKIDAQSGNINISGAYGYGLGLSIKW